MIITNKITGRGYNRVFSEDTQSYYVVVDWVDMNKIHADETVRRVFYIGNFEMSDDCEVYACFNVIPKSEYDRNVHVAVKIN